MKNIHKKRNLFGLIYALIMLLPMSSILVRCLYVTFNKNAFESYTGYSTYQNTLNLQEYRTRNNLSLQSYETSGVTNYYIDYSKINNIIYSSNIVYGSNPTRLAYGFNVTNIEIKTATDTYNYSNCFILLSKNRNDDVTGKINIYENYLFDQSNSYIEKLYDYYANVYLNGSLYSESQSIASVTYLSALLKDKLIYLSTNNDTNLNNTLSSFSTDIFITTSSLDNAFEYSLQTFVNDRGRGVLNLTDWFTSVFLEQNSHNQLYLDFVNWYMNYTLLISCVYLLYLVLMWFISLARRILTKYEEI